MRPELLFGKATTLKASKPHGVRALVLFGLLMCVTATWGASALIMNGPVPPSTIGGAAGSRTNATNNLKTQLENAGYVVTVSAVVPADVSGFDAIWDIDFVNPISEFAQGKYLAHLSSGKSLYLIGENQFMSSTVFEPRNSSILAFFSAAGGGSLTFQAPQGDDLPGEGGPQMIEVVQPPFTGPNPVKTVTYFSAGGVSNRGNGQFVTLRTHSTGTTATAVAYNQLVVVFDMNFLEGIYAPADAQPFLRNLIAYAPVPAPGPEIANILAGVGRPFGVAIYGGFAYVADPSSHTVWKVSLTAPFNKVPVAGIGWKTDVDPQDWQGYNGDGIEATEAQLDNPSGVAVDASGNIYIADTGNHAVRKIGTQSTFITTVAGIPTSYAVGESTLPECVNPPAGFDTSQCVSATNLRLFGPRAVAVDQAGHVYIADRMNQQVKKLHTSGTAAGFITVVAGVAGYTGGNDGPTVGPISCPPGTEFCGVAARLNSPVGVAVDQFGTVYIADEGNNRIRVVLPGEGAGAFDLLTLPAGALMRPTSVAVTADGGTIYIADYGNHQIRRATECGVEVCTLTTIAGTGTFGSSGTVGGPATSVQLNSPIAVSLDGDSLFIADTLNGRVLGIDLNP